MPSFSNLSNYLFFQSKHCSLDVQKASSGRSNLIEDWSRFVAEQDGAVSGFINGRPIREKALLYLSDDKKFEEESLNNFFKYVILKKVPDLYKVSALEKLKPIFHQGGLLHPVSSALTEVLTKQDGGAIMQPGASPQDVERLVSLQTTPEGFKLQEIVIIKRYLLPPGFEDCLETPDTLKAIANELGEVKRQNGEFIVKAEATLNVNLITADEKAQITPCSKHISYGLPEVQALLDRRSILERVHDFLLKLTGRNQASILGRAYSF